MAGLDNQIKGLTMNPMTMYLGSPTSSRQTSGRASRQSVGSSGMSLGRHSVAGTRTLPGTRSPGLQVTGTRAPSVTGTLQVTSARSTNSQVTGPRSPQQMTGGRSQLDHPNRGSPLPVQAVTRSTHIPTHLQVDQNQPLSNTPSSHRTVPRRQPPTMSQSSGIPTSRYLSQQNNTMSHHESVPHNQPSHSVMSHHSSSSNQLSHQSTGNTQLSHSSHQNGSKNQSSLQSSNNNNPSHPTMSHNQVISSNPPPHPTMSHHQVISSSNLPSHHQVISTSQLSHSNKPHVMSRGISHLGTLPSGSIGSLVAPPSGNIGPPPVQERTYINVTPVAVANRSGRVLTPTTFPAGQLGSSHHPTPKPQSPKVPAIPKSQEIKHKQEALYATILQMPSEPPSLPTSPDKPGERHMQIPEQVYANYAPASQYSNYSNYSELEALRSSDSQGSTEEEMPLPEGGLGYMSSVELPEGGMGYMSPPSPVSSSYSELRQANLLSSHNGQQYQLQPGQGPNMDSIYEPVQPSGANAGTFVNRTGKGHFKSLSSSSSDSDYFGTCVKCVDRIVGEGSGCSAMGRLYHIHCFTCSQCGLKLQGLPFYAVDGKPLCQGDYTNTLEKCCKCHLPILDRILRATGKPYHPGCFSCVVCSKSLDGIPFTVDATNQIHCIEDFHRRFAPRCSVCLEPIMPTPGQEETVRVVALDRSFHISCYRCVDCNLLLSSEAEGRGCYPLDNDVLCKQCNTRRIQALTSRISPD